MSAGQLRSGLDVCASARALSSGTLPGVSRHLHEEQTGSPSPVTSWVCVVTALGSSVPGGTGAHQDAPPSLMSHRGSSSLSVL